MPRWRLAQLTQHLQLPGTVLLCCALLGACTALPQLDRSGVAAPQGAPHIQGLRGEIPAARARSLLAKRWPQGRLDPATQAALEEAATGVPLIAGNRCTLLFDGPQTMRAMLAAIQAARNNINLETYIFDQDAMGLAFADALIAKQQQGVTVNIVYDSVGTLGVPAAFFERMRSAGIHLVEFNPISPVHARREGWRLNQRDHRKVLIVDGRIAFTGGINISASYANSSLFHASKRSAEHAQLGWRDTHIKIEGPAVQAFQWLFVRQWASQDQDDLREADYFPPPQIAGDKLVRVLATSSELPFDIYKAYQLAIQQARHSIHLTSAYFVPDPQTIATLSAAAQRGVDVRIVLPGVSDSGLVFYAGHAYYDQLLDSGVRIFQLQLRCCMPRLPSLMASGPLSARPISTPAASCITANSTW